VRQTPGGEHERKPQRKRTRRLPRRTSRTDAGGGAKTIRNGDAVENMEECPLYNGRYAKRTGRKGGNIETPTPEEPVNVGHKFGRGRTAETN